MGGARLTVDPARAEVNHALTTGRRRAGGGLGDPLAGRHALLALQRNAGNAAVSALMAAKLKGPGDQAIGDIDAALREIRRDEPAITTVEKGLRAAKSAGVPVELEGPKPPASALAVTMTGFGPAQVAPKKPVPPPKQLPAVSPVGKAAASAPKVGHAGPTTGSAGPAVGAAGPGGAGAASAGPATLSGEMLLQPPVAPTGTRPEQDPAFTKVASTVKSVAKHKKAHAPAAAKAKEAQDAAVAPADDLAGQAKAAKVDAMDAQPVGSFDKKAFIAAVKAAIEAKSPKTLKEADSYKESGKAGEVKGEVKGLVTKGKDDQAKDIEAATEAPPDQSKAVPKQVTAMPPEQAGHAEMVPAGGAVPKPAPPEQLNLAAGPHQANQEMADADVSEGQIAKSNEPEFQQALADKQAAAAHSASAPAQFRAEEKAVIGQSKAEATAQTAAGVQGMQGAKGAALASVVALKGATKAKDEGRRAEVTAKIQGIFATTEAAVKKILEGLDPAVEATFDAGEKDARAMFESFVSAKMSAYKADRYSGWLGGLRWAKDKLLGMPSKVNEFYEAGRELYLKKMDGVISRVADLVGNALGDAKKRIASGKAEIASYVKTLPADLQKVGSSAAKEINDKFQALEGEVDAKQEAVVDTLATKYVESRKGLDERIEALQAENKGLVDKAIGAIKAVINTIRELASMLKNVLARAAGVVGDIIKDPVGFLGNLISGIKGGILKFKDNILTHLRKGLLSWLFGALAEGGVELPETFDLKGIIKLLASIFGLTWNFIRNRIVKQIGEKAMSAVEKGVEIFQIIATQGIGGLWQMLVEKLGDIKEMILEQVKDFVITKVITAGITWLIGLLNPAAAFIKACKLIYDVVMFFVDNAARIMKFVNTIIDGVADVVRGNVGAVVNKIEDVLGQMVPILIGFLASVIGLGGIGQKIRQIIETLQKPIKKALDFVIKTGLKLAGPIIRGIKGISGKVKAKVAAGKAWVKGKAEAGKKWVKGKAEAGKKWVKGKVEGAKNAKPGAKTPDGTVIAVAEANAAGHSYQGKAVVRQGALRVDVQRTVVHALPAARLSARNASLPVREQLNRLVRSIQSFEARGVPTDRERVGRINALLAQIVQQDLVAAAAAAAGSPTGALGIHVTEFGNLTAPGARRNAYYMEFANWARVTASIRARDLSRIVAQVRELGGDWVMGETGLEPFLESLYDDIKLGSEGASDERIAGMPKYVPRGAIDSFRPVAAALRISDRASRRVDRVARQAALDTFLANIRNGSFAVDHRASLARHWNAEGHRSPAEVRARIASDPSNLVLVSFSWNSSKSGEGEAYSTPPAPGFTRHLGQTAAAPTAAPGAGGPSSGLLATGP